MAEQQTHDVVDQSQSVGAQSPSDVSATTNKRSFSQGEGDVEYGEDSGIPSTEYPQAQENSSEVAVTENLSNGVVRLHWKPRISKDLLMLSDRKLSQASTMEDPHQNYTSVPGHHKTIR